MFESLSIGATGMHAQQLQVETIANNLANVNTAGFKKGRVNFAELVARAPLPDLQGTRDLLAPRQASAAGVALAAATKVFDGGEMKRTESPLDLAIQGEGFLELAMPDGTRAYTRGGTLKVNADGQLALLDGTPFRPGIQIPDNAQRLVVSASGRVQVAVPGQANLLEAGQLELARFTNPSGLLAQGGGIYRATDASGEAIGGRPGEDGMGALAQGFLEGSNVKLVEEMVGLMVAQRAYEASAKVVQAADEMLGMVNGLRR
ncbi:MAG: flgG [Ramlibacter sp.]|uniref:flagellar basal-body rod protein FlgG n=1 Tax=Ramlibacter sp. TaxID=1917967 RepID=UPI00262E7E39|nr:flagellar basal-body rod protein FlgG [Ramlibacter sp.]MDB5752116.1 flgG [Ramlibacter sp.]